MAGRIPQYFIDDLLARINITEVVDSRVKLKRSGKNYSGLCPFHKESTPSFTVSPDKQFYYCFGCGAGGNALGFLMEYERLSFPEAVEELARMAGVDVPREQEINANPQREQKIRSQLNLLEQACDFYQRMLRESEHRDAAVSYLKKRGLSGQIAQHFKIGFAPPGWDNLLQQLDPQRERADALSEAGLVIIKEDGTRAYDRFRNRIMFPIRDMRGRVIAFGGRVLGDDKPKYLNSSETDTFHKSRELYGLYEARQSTRDLKRILIVEGYMDVVSLAQHGITWAVATLGTSTSDQHLLRLFKLVPELVFCFDGDQAGRNAAVKALEIALPLIGDGQAIRFLFLPEGEDPDTLVRQEGADAFTQRISSALPLSEFLFRHLSEEADLESLDGRARFADRALPMIRRMQPSLLQQMLFERVSQLTGLSLQQLNSISELQSPSSHRPANTLTAPTTELQPPVDDDYAHWSEAQTESLPPADWPQPSAPKRQHNTGLSLVNRTIALLIARPDLATSAPDSDQFGQLQENNVDLLCDLIDYLRAAPHHSIGTLMVDWQQQVQRSGHLLLLHEIGQRNTIPAKVDIASELRDCFQRLQQRAHELQLDQLLKKSRHTALSSEEKQRLQSLLLARHKNP